MKKFRGNGKLHLEHILISYIMILLVMSQIQFDPTTIKNLNLNTSSEVVIWDSIHTVFSPYDQLILQDLLFEKDWMYDFSLEVVTPHQCEINMTLTDPSGNHYNLFQGTVDQQSKEIQLGMVTEGAYNITMDAITQFTLNLHLKIERTVSFIDLFDQDDEIIALNGFRFSQSESLREVSVSFNPNFSYTINIALITPIVNNLAAINMFIDDPVDNHFIIYQDQALDELFLTFHFQTINPGIHKVQILIDNLETCLNLIVVVTLDNSDPPRSNDPPPGNSLYIPIEIQAISIGILLFAVLLTFLMKKTTRNTIIY